MEILGSLSCSEIMRRKATLLLILAIAAPFSGSLVSTSAEVSNPGQGKAIPAQRSEAQQSRRLAAGSERAEVSEASSHRSRDLAQFAGATNGTWCNSTGFPLVEATISQAHAAMLSGRLTCSYLIKVHTQPSSFPRLRPQQQSIADACIANNAGDMHAEMPCMH